MKSKTRKTEELKKVGDKIPNSKITVLTSFSRQGEKGLSVGQMSNLKKALKEKGAEYFVTKKTLVDIALKDKGFNDVNIFDFDGSPGLVFGDDDPYAISKSLYEFSKKNQALQLFGAIFENKFLSKEEFMEMAKLPSREVLLSRLMGMLTYPVRGLAVVLSEVAKGKEAIS